MFCLFVFKIGKKVVFVDYWEKIESNRLFIKRFLRVDEMKLKNLYFEKLLILVCENIKWRGYLVLGWIGWEYFVIVYVEEIRLKVMVVE